MSATIPRFSLDLCADCLKLLNKAALRSVGGMAKEHVAMDAGAMIAGGSNDVADLEAIADWKSARRRGLLKDNANPEALRTALDTARGGAEPRVKIDALCKLRGVGPRMASAILTCIDPANYTVIDVRALDTLGIRGRVDDASIYAEYLKFCIQYAAATGMKLRDFDRALWKAGAA